MFDRVVEKVAFDESEAATLLVQLLCATAFIHEQVIKTKGKATSSH